MQFICLSLLLYVTLGDCTVQYFFLQIDKTEKDID